MATKVQGDIERRERGTPQSFDPTEYKLSEGRLTEEQRNSLWSTVAKGIEVVNGWVQDMPWPARFVLIETLFAAALIWLARH